MANTVFLGISLLSLTLSGYHAAVEKPQDTTTTPVRPTDLALLELQGRVKSVTFHHCRILKQSQGDNKICKDKTTIFFNAAGYKTEEWYWDDFPVSGQERLRRKDMHFYDKENRLLKILSYDSNNTLITTYSFRLDPTGNKIEDIFDKDNILTARYITTYDANGRRIQMIGFGIRDSAKSFMKDTYKYDRFGNLIEEKSESKSAGNSLDLHGYEYNKDNRIIKKTSTSTWSDYKHRTVIQYVHDRAGHVVQEITKHQDWRPRKTTITWDTAGNWLLRTENESKNTVLTSERTIEYY